METNDKELEADMQPEDAVEAIAESVAEASETVAEEEQASQEADVQQLADELKEAKDREMRATAELENFRKRVFRQMEEERKYASMPLMRDVLSVVDNLDRAISAAEADENSSGLLEGVKMVAQQLSAVLQQHHCERIDAKGQAFDPHLHEAIAHHPNEDHAEGTVVEQTQVGYVLHDRVIRPSQVLVSAGSAQPDD
jgi:molecular chaperone GrpE